MAPLVILRVKYTLISGQSPWRLRGGAVRISLERISDDITHQGCRVGEKRAKYRFEEAEEKLRGFGSCP